MKKMIIAIIMATSMALVGYQVNLLPAPAEVVQTQPKETTVLVCNSSSAYAYHAYMCSGLKRCTHSISKVDRADAINAGRRACKICYR